MGSVQDDRDYYRSAYRRNRTPWSGLNQLDRRTEQWIDEIGGTLDDKTMLDLGTGEGRIVDLFSTKGFSAFGIDYLLEAIQQAVEVTGTSRSSFLVADMFGLPFRESSFDVVVDYGLLHHVRKSNWNQYRDALLSVLEAGGYLFVSVFHEEDGHANRKTRDWVYHRGHYDRFFTPEGLDDCLGSAMKRETAGKIRDGKHVFLHARYRRR
jgi:SAM-dependent methyltransferase